MVAQPRNHQQMEKAEPRITYVGVLKDPFWAHQTNNLVLENNTWHLWSSNVRLKGKW